jgi:hypothetical protein
MLSRLRQAPKSALFLSTIALAFIATASVPRVRHSALRSLGSMLVAEDPLQPAELIVISGDSLGPGVLEAADLFKAGFAHTVAVFDRPATRSQREFARRGLPSPDPRAFSMQLLRASGISNILVIPAVAGTVDEGVVLREWCMAHSIHSIIFVSVADHSRRTRRVLQRALGPVGIRVRVRYARFSDFDPDAWWSTRTGQRILIVESQKLLLDYFRHPF